MLKTFKKVARQYRFGLAIPIIIILAGSTALPLSWSVFEMGSSAHAETNEKVYYYLHDHLGGIEAVVDEEGNVMERKDYLPYGSERMSTEGSDEDYGYTGKELDDGIGLYYYGARYYNPMIGKFTQIDPLVLDESSKPLTSALENPQALNSYSYVLNSPMRYVDEEGEYGKDVHYDLTLFLSLAAGLDFGQAKTVAFFDQYTDENPSTLPKKLDSAKGIKDTARNLSDGTVSEVHFTTRNEAIGLIVNAYGSKRLDKFGEALHSFQDTFSHQYLNPATHALATTMPDQTYLAPEKALRMARESFFFIRGMNAYSNGIGDMTWENYNAESNKMWSAISKDVKTYLEMTDKSGHYINNLESYIGQGSTNTSEDEEERLNSK